MDEKLNLRFYQKDGRTQATLAKSERPEDMICDFCSEHTEPFTEYPCGDFSLGQVESTNMMSRGGFAACPTCARLINTNDRAALLDRSVKSFIAHQGKELPEAMVKMIIGETHKLFFENRKQIK
jgi:hypothetical protein